MGLLISRARHRRRRCGSFRAKCGCSFAPRAEFPPWRHPVHRAPFGRSRERCGKRSAMADCGSWPPNRPALAAWNGVTATTMARATPAALENWEKGGWAVFYPRVLGEGAEIAGVRGAARAGLPHDSSAWACHFETVCANSGHAGCHRSCVLM